LAVTLFDQVAALFFFNLMQKLQAYSSLIKNN